MPTFKVTYEPETGLTDEMVEADQMAEGPHFLICVQQTQPVLRIKAAVVRRVELES